MFVIIGSVIVMGAILLGFVLSGGKIPVLIQINEFIVIGGAALGSVLIANPLPTVMATVKAVFGLLKGNPYTKDKYMELMKMLYAMFLMARREGLVSLDQHVENPHESTFFKEYAFFHANHHAVAFLADTMKVVITGSVAIHDLSEMMDIDLETAHEEMMKPAGVVTTVSDAMPGFGIVAAVLGVVITMGAIGGPPEQVGHHVAAALVGTFIGILLSYGFLGPMAKSMEGAVKAEAQYMGCIKNAVLSFARGDAPATCVEFARRNIEPSVRPSFMETEEACKAQGKAA
ncbi:MAG: flagellar motor stator protein MotA [Chthonomonadaceae bacterium]|nr:flagellar motor stator protein MotA [Chthonomonadaceae bacterium]